MDAIVFWQNCPSIHQAPLIREFAALVEVPVLVLTEDDVPDKRRAQGWDRPDYGRAELIVRPDTQIQAEALSGDAARTVHVFSGINAFPFVYRAFRKAATTRTTLGVFVEAGQHGGLMGLARRLLHRSNAVRFGRRIDFLLATGTMGVTWYREVGFATNKLLEFAYFVETLGPNQNVVTAKHDQVFSCIFVGELAKHKGCDILIRALSSLQHRPWRLEIIGRGHEEGRSRNLAASLGIEQRLSWHAALSNAETRLRIAAADCLILPSRYDGWGAVVNEALMVGTPVICTEACGAAALLRSPELGSVVPAGDVLALRLALERHLEAGPVGALRRTRIRTWAERISPTQGARYLMAILDHVRGGCDRPLPPWRS